MIQAADDRLLVISDLVLFAFFLVSVSALFPFIIFVFGDSSNECVDGYHSISGNTVR